MSVRLCELFAALPNAAVSGPVDPQIESIVADSRAVTPGALFVALRGEHVDGHDYIDRALEAGAVAVVVSKEKASTSPALVRQAHHDTKAPPHTATIITVADTQRAASQLAAAFYAHPSKAMHVVGVTGTNGKTTTTHFIARAVEAAGHRCAIVGTLGAFLGDRHWPLANTTPLAIELQALLAELRDAGATHVAMEVSSHALAQDRVADVALVAGALTNVTRDHLDFHGTFEAYAAAKRRLFDMAPERILNVDDATGYAWSKAMDGVTTYGIDREAAIRARGLELHADGSAFTVDELPVRIALAGRFNVSNALAALGAARALGIDDRVTARGLASLERVPGRMERVQGPGFSIVVDYAHTPDALERALRAAREFTPGRLIAVFGAGGDRDRGKRPLMGRIASELADAVIVTSDNPRTEKPGDIIAEIVAGIEPARTAVVKTIADRRSAIETAVSGAAEGDTIVIAGKGHEPYQIVGTQTLPFDDCDEARAAIAKRSVVRA